MKTIAVDFDGVIHGYSQGWHDGTIYDPPVIGAGWALQALADEYHVVVFTAREDIDGIQAWLELHNLWQYVQAVTNDKPKAWLYIDDRALRFKGNWTTTMNDVAMLAEPDQWEIIG